MNLKEGVFAFRNVRLAIHFFFHLMLGVTHLLLEKDFSSANFELNSGTIEIRCKIFKAFSRYTRAACADDDHS